MFIIILFVMETEIKTIQLGSLISFNETHFNGVVKMIETLELD